MFIADPDAGPQMPVITTGSLSVAAAATLYDEVMNQGQLQVTAIVVKALCQADSCRYH